MAQLAINYSILKVFLPISFPNSLLAQILRHSKTSVIVIFCEKVMKGNRVMKPIRNGRAGGMPDFGASMSLCQDFGTNLTSLNFYNLLKLKGIIEACCFCLTLGIME